MHGWSAERIAAAAGARLVAPAAGEGGPSRVTIDSREVAPGDLFVGLPGTRADGGRFAGQALAAGAWGALVAAGHAEHVEAAGGAAAVTGAGPSGALLASDDPKAALGRLARAWRRELGASVIAVTGSTGKTSTKDIAAAMAAASRRVVATEGNLNTEIGLPLTVLGAPPQTELLVLELAMRGAGQIAELTAIAEPDVGVIVNVGPVHLELLGSIEAIAAAKAELIRDLAPGATAVIPAAEPLLAVHRRDDLTTVTFGPGGDVDEADLAGLELGLDSAHLRLDAMAALAAVRAAGVAPAGRIDVRLSARRGQRIALARGVVVVNDCYNANPMSMRAALDDLAASAPGRRVAVLGDMLELGPDAERFHAEIGAHARRRADLLVTVGPLAAGMGGDHAVADAEQAAALVAGLLEPGDTVLVKGSRGVGLEAVAETLR